MENMPSTNSQRIGLAAAAALVPLEVAMDRASMRKPHVVEHGRTEQNRTGQVQKMADSSL